ncbi:MAG: methyl-accepting chemotaxis protein [Agathobacter sp.]|nr:methyl-accepting chemotaxis protein [Agathobacter sp.]
MFGKKKYSKEELEQAGKNIEQGNQLLLEFSGKKDWVNSNYDRISQSRQQMESDMDRILEHISSASEEAKHESEITAALSQELDTVYDQMQTAESNYRRTTELIKAQLTECQNLVEENKHFTTPSKYLSELPNQLRACNGGYRTALSTMSEQGKQMGVLALNAAIEAGRMGEAGRQFVTAAEEIRNYSKHYEDSAKELQEQLDASDAKIIEMEETIHHLIGLLKESNMGSAHLLKELMGLQKHVDSCGEMNFSDNIKTTRQTVTQLRNSSEEIIKSEERSRMQMEDIAEEVESQKKSEQEVVGELQKLFYATGLYVELINKGEEQ